MGIEILSPRRLWEATSDAVVSLACRTRIGSGENETSFWRLAEYKRTKEVWNPRKGRYITMRPDNKSELSKLDRYVFVARERVDFDTQESTLYLDIQSALLRGVLEEICHDIWAISLAGSRPSVDAKHFFHLIDPLREYVKANLDEDKDDVTTTTKKHVELLIDMIEQTYKDERERQADLIDRGMITYDLLWTLFKPNAEVYSRCDSTHVPRCSLFRSSTGSQAEDGSRCLEITTVYLDYNDKRFGESFLKMKVPSFDGEKPIRDLPCMPLDCHSDKEKIRQVCVESGRLFASLFGSHHHRAYDGIAFTLAGDPPRPRCLYVKGRIMVDTATHLERNPGYMHTHVYKSSEALSITKLSDKQLMICSWKVYGFCLTEKLFLEFAVCKLKDIEWSSASFADVKIPEVQKMPLQALTATYLRREPENAFRDLVHGKGRGINFLLYGPPGVGKTLTAETLAETFKLPLYTVAAGQLGVDPETVEENLTDIFKTASRWKSILLLDEADVFLACRQDGHTQLNALVSVFLRELEQYDGILFLTTNRVQSFDEAMISRIHLALKYEPLKKDARIAIWEYFMKQAKNQYGEPTFGDGFIKHELAAKKLNGREIRNAVFIARSMAEYQETAVTEKHLRDSIAAREDFEYDFRGAGSMDNNHSYF